MSRFSPCDPNRPEWQHQVDAFLAGELSETDRAALERALRSEVLCQELLQEQAALDGALRALLSPEATGSERDFVEGVMASLQVKEERSLAKSVLTEILDERDRAQRRPFPWVDLLKAGAGSCGGDSDDGLRPEVRGGQG